MIRPNLRSIVAAFAVLIGAAPAAVAQYAPNQPLIQLPRSNYQAPIVDHYSEPSGPLWNSQQPIEHFVEEVAARSSLKLEFMLFNFSDVGDGTIGAPVSGLGVGANAGLVDGISVPFSINDNLHNGDTTGLGLFPQLDSINTGDSAGGRGTWILDLEEAEMELSFFGFENASGSLVYADIDGPRIRLDAFDAPAGDTDTTLGTLRLPNYAIPLLTGGNVAGAGQFNSLIFNDSFAAHSETQMWGTELMFLSRKKLPGGAGMGLQYLGGVRYSNVDDGFRFAGSFDGRGFAAPPQGGASRADVPSYIASVNSTTHNNLYGPELGLRWSLTSKYLTLSATPRVMLGINDYRASLSSSMPTSVGGTVQSAFNSDGIEFATMSQVALNAEVHMNENFSIFGGYDFMWLTGMTRANENIVYDSATNVGGGFTPNIRQNVELNDFMANGFTFGAVFRY